MSEAETVPQALAGRDAAADARSWNEMLSFFDESFGETLGLWRGGRTEPDRLGRESAWPAG